MFINKSNIQDIANLSLLKVSKLEEKKLLLDLNELFNLIKEIQKINTKNIEPLSHPTELIQNISLIFRKDIEENNIKKNKYKYLSSNIQNGYYTVPKIIE